MTNVQLNTTTTTLGVVVTVTGDHGAGSDGNDDASAILQALEAALAESGDRRVVLDMSGMRYTWGDAIGTVFVLHMHDNVDFVLNRSCAEAWNGLLSMVAPAWVDAPAGRVLFKGPPRD